MASVAARARCVHQTGRNRSLKGDSSVANSATKKTYDPYGGHATATALNGALPANPWRYAGGSLDATGLYHFGARYYDPALGRWTQQDSVISLGDPANANRNAYAGDDPVNFVDPSGRSKCGHLSLGLVVDCASKAGKKRGPAAAAVGTYVGVSFVTSSFALPGCFVGYAIAGPSGCFVGAGVGAIAAQGVSAYLAYRAYKKVAD